MRVIESKPRHDRRRGADRRRAGKPQGHQPARYAAADQPADRQGPRRPRLRARRSAPTGSRCRSCSAPRTCMEAKKHHRRPRRACWPRSKSRRPSTISTPSSRPATASWSRAAISASRCRSSGCRACRSRSRARRARRQAGRRRDADAGKHDLVADADARRSVGRRDRRVRRRGCGDAVGRIRRRPVSRSRPFR